MKLYTSQYHYSGPDRLDITVKGNDPFGHHFAPSHSLLMGYHGGHLNSSDYILEYNKQMILLIERSPELFSDLLSRERVVLVCFCNSKEFCHRYLLATILEHMGAEYCGEI